MRLFQSGKRAIKSAVKYIRTAGIKNLDVKSHASVAKRNVLSLPQLALNQSDSHPVNALRVATLNEKIKNVTQSRAMTLMAGEDQNQPSPAPLRIIKITTASSIIHNARCRTSRSTSGS